MSFMIETSARHIHLTQETLEKLFGEGYELTVRKPLSYPGQFASNERLTVVGPKKEMANVSILGPVRKMDQIELSATDARTLGIDAPVRESGDVKGSGACKLVGPKGEVELTEGVIIAKRHLHITEADAAEMGVKNGEIIKVACGGEGRKLILTMWWFVSTRTLSPPCTSTPTSLRLPATPRSARSCGKQAQKGHDRLCLPCPFLLLGGCPITKTPRWPPAFR